MTCSTRPANVAVALDVNGLDEEPAVASAVAVAEAVAGCLRSSALSVARLSAAVSAETGFLESFAE
jgi:hypothetical protein